MLWLYNNKKYTTEIFFPFFTTHSQTHDNHNSLIKLTQHTHDIHYQTYSLHITTAADVLQTKIDLNNSKIIVNNNK